MKDIIPIIILYSLALFSIVAGIYTISYPSFYEEKCQSNALGNAKKFATDMDLNLPSVYCSDRMIMFTDMICYAKTTDNTKIMKLACSYEENSYCEILSSEF